MKFLSIFVLLGLSCACNAAKILILSQMPTRSHYNLFDKLAIQLTKRGHHVTLITPYKQDKPVANLTEIVLDNIYDKMLELFRSSKDNNTLTVQLSPWENIRALPKLGQFLTETVLEMPSMKKFLKENREYDLIIAENFVSEAVFAGMSVKYKAPLIALAPFMVNHWSNLMVGNPAPSSFIPDPFLGYWTKMTFFERLTNTVYSFIQEMYHQMCHLPAQDALMKKYFGSHLPPLEDILRNTSMVLVNHHHSLAYPRPLLPNMIEIGGYHVLPPQPLPQELKNYLENSKNGVILFSMGSHVKSKDMSKEMLEKFLRAFARLKYDVLWKFEDDSLRNLPKNVKIMKWLPQSDLLAHPNVKLFITHGGLLSTIETVVRGVPILGIPVLGDQKTNMVNAARGGYGLFVDLETLNENNLYSAIQEVMNNPKYRECMKEKSKIILDQPMQPMESAIFWIEYVIRHKGARHMRSAAQDLKWYELYMLDVLAVFSSAALVLALAVYFLARLALRAISWMMSGNKTGGKASLQKKTN